MQQDRRRPAAKSIAGVFHEMMKASMEGASALASREKAAQQAAEAEQPEGLYIISVAARILSMHPQTLRKYERVGLVRPSRTVGMLRLYSREDITKLRVIKRLVDEVRLNLAGVEMAMAVFDRLSAARYEMNRRASAQAFDRMFDHIMELFEGSSHRSNNKIPRIVRDDERGPAPRS
jgi:MerR family transcriptional regulator/heat shock protein HspR